MAFIAAAQQKQTTVPTAKLAGNEMEYLVPSFWTYTFGIRNGDMVRTSDIFIQLNDSARARIVKAGQRDHLCQTSDGFFCG